MIQITGYKIQEFPEALISKLTCKQKSQLFLWLPHGRINLQ